MLDTLRRRFFPLAVWCGVMGTAAWLWWGVHASAARGYVEGIAYEVTSLEPGRIAQVTVIPGQHVRPGQVIAVLDGRELDAELKTLDAERIRVEAELAAAASQTQLIVGETTRGIEESVDSTEIARQQARAQKSVSTAELAALEKQMDAVRELVDKKMADKRELAELAVTEAALRKEVQVADALIRQLDAAAASARARRGGLPPKLTIEATEPLRAELDIIRTKQELLELRKQSLALRAPGAGEVTEVLLLAGETAIAGSIVATIAGPAALGAGGTPQVFACATEAESTRVQVGEAVTLSPPTGGGPSLAGHVDRLAPAVALLPPRCWIDPRIPLWGRGIYISVDDPVNLLPGQSFALSFTGDLSDRPVVHPPEPTGDDAGTPAESTPPSKPVRAVDHAAPVAIVVPTSLRARTRFEPSAILWSPVRGRYLVVSDDTGLEKVDEHAPLLFSMTKDGVLDETPVRIDGVDELNDLESIAAAPDGGIYLLASQSRSRKGKRSAARQFFGHVAMTATDAHVTASVELASLLDADAAVRASLGLDDTAALDIEGMTATRDGGLLFGLKGPVPSEGAAIWHIADPDRLLAAGNLAAGSPSLWGHVPLRVRADGAEVTGGVSELLELPDGRLLIGATAAGDAEPTSQDGAVFEVANHAGLASPSLLRSFPGLKPEGLARTPDGGGMAIVFDTGDATPLWMEHRWPAP